MARATERFWRVWRVTVEHKFRVFLKKRVIQIRYFSSLYGILKEYKRDVWVAHVLTIFLEYNIIIIMLPFLIGTRDTESFFRKRSGFS